MTYENDFAPIYRSLDRKLKNSYSALQSTFQGYPSYRDYNSFDSQYDMHFSPSDYYMFE